MSAQTCLQWFDWNGREDASSRAQGCLTSLGKSTIEERALCPPSGTPRDSATIPLLVPASAPHQWVRPTGVKADGFSLSSLSIHCSVPEVMKDVALCSLLDQRSLHFSRVGLNCGKNWGTFCEFWGSPLWDREACSRWHCETRELGCNHATSRYVTRASSVRTGL